MSMTLPINSAYNNGSLYSSQGSIYSGGNAEIKPLEFGSVSTQPKVASYQGRVEGPKPSITDKMEYLAQFQDKDGNLSIGSVNPYGSNPIETSSVNTYETRGAAWDGFSTQANNGTGELVCKISGREDAIEGSPLPSEGLWG